MDQDANGTVVGLGSGDIVLDRDPAPPQKGGTVAPTFRPMYCAQTAGCINMPLGTVAGLGSGHHVLDGEWGPSQKGVHSSPSLFVRCLLWSNGWMDQDTTWYGGMPRPK